MGGGGGNYASKYCTSVILSACLNVKISSFTQALKSDVELPCVNGCILSEFWDTVQIEPVIFM